MFGWVMYYIFYKMHTKLSLTMTHFPYVDNTYGPLFGPGVSEPNFIFILIFWLNLILNLLIRKFLGHVINGDDDDDVRQFKKGLSIYYFPLVTGQTTFFFVHLF